MKRHLPLSFTLLLLCFTCSNLWAEVYPISFAQRVSQAQTIALVTLEDQHSYKDDQGQQIFTLNHLKVMTYLKGHRQDAFIYLITPGGIVGNEGQYTFPSARLDKHHEYIVMLAADNQRIDDKAFRALYPNRVQALAYGSKQGILTLQDGLYKDLLVLPPSTEGAIFRHIAQLIGEESLTPNGELFPPRIHQIPSPNRATISALKKRSGVGGFAGGTIDSSYVLVIEGGDLNPLGLGFPTPMLTVSTVEFSNADDGGATMIQCPVPITDIFQWQADSIEVMVPDQAGTGIVRVSPFGTTAVTSPITIDWSVVPSYSTTQGFTNSTRQRLEWLDINNVGGYTFEFESAVLTNTSALAAYIRAMETWRCNSSVNIQYSTLPVNLSIAQNGISQVVFEPASNLPAGVLYEATLRFNSSFAVPSCVRFNTLWRVTELDIAFVDAPGAPFSWNFGPGASAGNVYDFESVALTAIGRAMGIGYINDITSAMHYMLPAGTDRRNLSSGEINAAQYKMAHSIVPNCIIPPNPMTAVSSLNCVLAGGIDNPPSGDIFKENETLFSLSPNPVKNFLSMELLGAGKGTASFRLMDLSGRQLLHQQWEHEKESTGQIDLKGLSSGIYLYHLDIGQSSFQGKLVKE